MVKWLLLLLLLLLLLFWGRDRWIDFLTPLFLLFMQSIDLRCLTCNYDTQDVEKSAMLLKVRGLSHKPSLVRMKRLCTDVPTVQFHYVIVATRFSFDPSSKENFVTLRPHFDQFLTEHPLLKNIESSVWSLTLSYDVIFSSTSRLWNEFTVYSFGQKFYIEYDAIQT
jgi:hypothetical protein